MIKTIPMWKIMLDTKGIIVSLFIMVSLPFFIIGGAWMLRDGVQNGDVRVAIGGLLSLIFFGGGALLITISKKYIPGKTFLLYRNKKLHTQKALNYSYAVTIAIIVLFVIVVPDHAFNTLVYGLVAIFSFYAYSKSLKFHADVDYSTNEYLATALGFPAGEKILVSYQNFDAEEVKVGSSAFAATATKLIVASFDGDAWIKLSRDLNQISGIGIMGDQSHNYFVKLQFNDGTDALLRVGLYEKLTSNPILVIRKLLEAIDASLLGANGAPQAAQRRRVVVNSTVPASFQKNVAPEAALASVAPMRNIEVAPDVLIAIRAAEEVAPGRRLEL
jgi:hypothetical protein